MDDEPRVLELVRAVLPSECDFFVAHDGAEGYEEALRVRPDLILADILMPVMDGYTMLRKLRGNPDTRDIPTVMLTARTDTSSIFHAQELGASDYLMKPFQVDEVPAIVRRHIL